MDRRTLQGAEALYGEVRAELDALEHGISRLRELLDSEPASEADAPTRFTRATAAHGTPAARVVAAQMALSGSPRADTHDRLAGLVPEDQLREILDEAYAV